MKKVYKVVFSSGGEFFSVMGLILYKPLRYKLGEVTVPEVGKIFAFDTLENAKEFYFDKRQAILECETESEITYASYCLGAFAISSYENLVNFWNGENFPYNVFQKMPEGGVVVDSLKPVQIVYG